MNIIIVGCGRIGSTLVEELSGENHDISIIDEKADVVQKLARQDRDVKIPYPT